MTDANDPAPQRDIYQAPAAELELKTQAGLPYYVVSRTKFTVLFVATLGIYGIYWFYRHWRNYRDYSGDRLWPVPRAIFSIFFVHALFARIYAQVRDLDAGFEWRYRLHAWLYILFSVISTLSDKLVSFGLDLVSSTLIGIAAMFVVAWILGRAQLAANLACEDPRGSANSRFGAANIAWIMAGLLLWMLTIVGMAVSLGPQGSVLVDP